MLMKCVFWLAVLTFVIGDAGVVLSDSEIPPPAPNAQPPAETTAATPGASETKPTSATAETFATFGLVAQKPAGWLRIPEENLFTAVRWVRLGEQHKPLGVIMIERLPASHTPWDDLLARLRRKLPTEEPATTLGDEPATFLTGAAEGPEFRPVAVIAARHGEAVYSITCFAAGQEPWREALEQVRKGVRFVDPVEPAQCLAVIKSPALTMPGLMLADVPEIMRTVRISEPSPAQALAIRNHAQDRDEFSLQVNLVYWDAEISPADGQERFAAEVAKRFRIKEPLKWTRLDRPFYVSVSTPVTAAVATRDEKTGDKKRQATRVAYGLAFPTDKKSVLFTFNILTPDEKDQAAYEEAIRRIMASVRKP